MNMTTRIAFTVLAIAGGIGPAPAHAQRPDLSGRWTYNAAQSDNPRDMRQASDSASENGRGRRGGGGFGGRRGGFGGAGRGGYGGGSMTDEQRARMRQTMALVFDAPQGFTLSETDSTMTITPDTGAVLVLYGDGRKLKQTVEGGGDVEIKARWQGNDFVIERKVSGGGKVTEDYLRSQDGKQLYVIVNFEGNRGRALAFRRVYDAVGS